MTGQQKVFYMVILSWSMKLSAYDRAGGCAYMRMRHIQVHLKKFEYREKVDIFV